ncbi:Putative phage host specificity protein (phage tail protein) (fragment) [Xenorhabdus cabanillasii JM26]|uniref:Phage host specificity protein ( phage tail protein) n=1 Tax=Xenorhabdus cabanillasii JM26 TaxID=1427517 RepID=W1IMX1_9GAMM
MKVGERLILNLPSGKAEGRTIQAVNGKVVTVSTDYTEMPAAECVWVIDAAYLAVQLFRVTGIKEGEDGVSFEITAVEHNADKYDHIDTGTRLDERPISVIPPGVQPPPKNVAINSYSVVSQGIAVTTLRVTWDAAESAIAYEAEWRRDNGNWISAPRTSAQGFEVPNIYAGRYQARVRAINAAEISSIWANAPETHLKGKEGNPPAPLAFRAAPIIFGIQLDWGFALQTDDTLKTEIQYSQTNDGEGVMLLADIPYPQKTHTMQGLAAGVVFYFRARLVDKSGNQSRWTDFIRGESSTDTSWITRVMGDQFLTTEAGKRLQEQLNYQAEAELINSVAIQQNAHQLLVKDGENKAEIRRIDRAFADEKASWAESFKEVKADLVGVKDEVRTEVRASIQESQKAIANMDKALAESEQRTQAQFKDQSAIIREKATAVFDIDGNGYAIKEIGAGVKYNGILHKAGMVIGAEVKNGQVATHFGVSANQFMVMNPDNNKLESVFMIKDGQVFIRDALMDKAVIQHLLVGAEIKSTNYTPGQSGFYWNMKSGQIENIGSDSQGKMKQTNTTISIADNKGRLRVQIGKITGAF